MANTSQDIGNLLTVMAPNTATGATGRFNDALLEMLKRQQSLGTLGLEQRQMQYETEQANRGLAATPEGQRTFSPEQQNAIRTSQMQAIQPSIEGVQGRAQTFSEQIANMGNMLAMARQLSEDMENRKLQREQFAQQMALERAKLAQSGSSRSRNLQTIVGPDGGVYSFDPETGAISSEPLLGAQAEPTMADQVKAMKKEGWGRADVADYFTSQEMSVPKGLLDSIYGPEKHWYERNRVISGLFGF